MARRDRRARGQAVSLLDHVSHCALRTDHPRRLRLPAALNDARAHQELIDQLWDFSDAPASEQRFRTAAESADEPDRSILLTQVARALGLAADYQSAQEVLDSIPASAGEVAVRVLLERGRVLNSSGSPAEARPLFESAFAAASDAGFEYLAIDALHMVAIVAPVGEQEALNRQALALAAAADDPRARQWRASLLNNLGWTLFERGDLAHALGTFEDALAARIAQGKPPEIQFARWCVGRTLRAIGRLDEARAIQLSLAAEHRAAGTADSFVQEELAELDLALKGGPPPTPE